MSEEAENMQNENRFTVTSIHSAPPIESRTNPPDIRVQHGYDDEENERENDPDNRFIRLERAPYTEMISEGGKWEVVEAVRVTAAGMEEQIVLDFDQRPDTYWSNIRTGELRERRRSLKFTYLRHPRLMLMAGNEKRELIANREKREELKETVDNGYRELRARTKLAEQLGTQEAFSGDIAQYLDTQFKRVSDTIPARFYEYIFNARETAEGFVEYGDKVEEAFRAFIDIGEGNAQIEVDGEMVFLPNIFAMPANRGVQEIAFKEYVVPRLRNMRNNLDHEKQNLRAGWKDSMPHLSQSEALDVMDELEEWDDESAAITALALWRHWDYDVKYAFGRKGSGAALEVDQIPVQEWSEVGMETGAAAKDSAKLDIELRRASEWGRGVSRTGRMQRREHIRPAGNPVTFGVYPRMIITAPEVITTEVPLDESIMQQINTQTGLERDDFEFKGTDSNNKFAVSVHDYAIKRSAKVELKVGDQSRMVDLRFENVSLGSVGWDDAVIVGAKDVATGGGGQKRYAEIAAGPQSDAFHVPYQLAGMYMHKLYEQIMREDYLVQYGEVVDVGKTNLLLRLNKPIDNAMAFLQTKHGLSDPTVKKLSNLVRANFLGGVLCQVSSSNSGQAGIEQSQLSQYTFADYQKEANNRVHEAARVQTFLPVDDDGKKLNPQWRQVVESVVNRKKGFLPSQAKLNGEPLFTDEELESLKPLYPLGV